MLHAQEWRSQRNHHQHYSVGLAQSADEIEAAQRLRYRVFAEELGARLNTRKTGVDIDFYDAYCEHLVVRDEQWARWSAPIASSRRKPPSGSAATTRTTSST